MLEYRNGVFFEENTHVAHAVALKHIVQALSLSASGETPLKEDEVRAYWTLFDHLSPFLPVLSEEDLYDSFLHSLCAVMDACDIFSGHVLARILFLLGEELEKKSCCRALNNLAWFCSQKLFSIMLHNREYYLHIAYSFYEVSKTHEAIEGKGYFDVIRYIERKRDYNGSDIDFMHMTAYYAGKGIALKNTPLHMLEYFRLLKGIYEDYRRITDNTPGRYEKTAEAYSLMRLCMQTAPLDDGETIMLCPGAAYMLALHSGAYKKRRAIAKRFGADCERTDLDYDERRYAYRAILLLVSVLVVGFFTYRRIFLFYKSNPLLFSAVAGFAVFFLLIFFIGMGSYYSGKGGTQRVFVTNWWWFHH